jgi:hypothetical protein
MIAFVILLIDKGNYMPSECFGRNGLRGDKKRVPP